MLKDDVAGASQAMSDHLRAARDRAIARVSIVSRDLAVANLAYLRRLG
jgi:hypothetical protein